MGSALYKFHCNIFKRDLLDGCDSTEGQKLQLTNQTTLLRVQYSASIGLGIVSNDSTQSRSLK